MRDVSQRQRPALTLVTGQRQHRRTAGFASPFALAMVALAMMLFAAYYAALSTLPGSVPAAETPAPAPGTGLAYVPYVFADQDTGCQYLSTHTSTGLVPRIAADGKTHLGCKGGTQ